RPAMVPPERSLLTKASTIRGRFSISNMDASRHLRRGRTVNEDQGLPALTAITSLLSFVGSVRNPLIEKRLARCVFLRRFDDEPAAFLRDHPDQHRSSPHFAGRSRDTPAM